MTLVQNWMQQMRPDFELGLLIPFSLQITITKAVTTVFRVMIGGLVFKSEGKYEWVQIYFPEEVNKWFLVYVVVWLIDNRPIKLFANSRSSTNSYQVSLA